MFTREGCERVRTYIQSGNVIFDAEPETLRGLPDRISQRILGRFGCKSPVIVRSTAELRRVVYNNPFLTPEATQELGGHAALGSSMATTNAAQPPLIVSEPSRTAAPAFTEEMLHVFFLAHSPTEDALSQLDHDRSLPDTFHVRGKEIYVQLPRGVAYTKLTNSYFDSYLGTVSTSRNWRTVRKLAELAGA